MKKQVTIHGLLKWSPVLVCNNLGKNEPGLWRKVITESQRLSPKETCDSVRSTLSQNKTADGIGNNLNIVDIDFQLDSSTECDSLTSILTGAKATLMQGKEDFQEYKQVYTYTVDPNSLVVIYQLEFIVPGIQMRLLNFAGPKRPEDKVVPITFTLRGLAKTRELTLRSTSFHHKKHYDLLDTNVGPSSGPGTSLLDSDLFLFGTESPTANRSPEKNIWNEMKMRMRGGKSQLLNKHLKRNKKHRV